MLSSDLSKLRIDHIGSLVRPAKLKEAFARHDDKQAPHEELKQAQDDAIREVIHKQEEHGLPVVTDGEFRRHNFQESFSECVTGFDVPQNISRYYEKRNVNENPLERAEQDFDEAGPAIVTRRGTVERLKLVRNLPLEEFRFAQSVATAPVKVTVLGPDRIAQRFRWEDLARSLQRLGRFRRSRRPDRTSSHHRFGERRLQVHPNRCSRVHRLCR